MDIVEQSGTGFAFPSQTLYFTRDEGLDVSRPEAAEARVRKWRLSIRRIAGFPRINPRR